MVGSNPVSHSKDADKPLSANNLVLRVASAVVLAPLALLAAYYGGWPFVLFWGVAALAVLWEWIELVAGKSHRPLFLSCAGAVAAAGFLAWLDRPISALLMLGLGALAAAIFSPSTRRLWVTLGIGYAGAMLLAPIFLRHDAAYGFGVIVMLFAVVWATDVCGYFAGRAFGGPKLLPVVSPKKTWSGAIAGTAGAMIAGLLAAGLFGSFNTIAILVDRIRAVSFGAMWRFVRILGEKAVRRERLQSSHSRSRRGDGPARWVLGSRRCRLPDRIDARRLRWACARSAGMVSV